MKYPDPKIVKRVSSPDDYELYKDQGLTDIQASILSSRRPQNIDPMSIVNPDSSMIPEPLLLSDMYLASKKIAEYLLTDSRPIVISSDFDVDGISSAAILMSILSDGGILDINGNKVIPIISNRLNDGYGFTDKVVDKIIAMDVIPGMVITADHGSSNGKQVTRLKNELEGRGHKIDIIITDHHSISEDGAPKDASAFINPNQEGDTYPDKTVCGATVAWLTMLATLNELKSNGILPLESCIEKELDFACAATVADCVSIASPANRYIIKNGLSKMNADSRPAWTAFKDLMATPYEGITTDTIGFQLGPKINANSRMGFDGKYALDFLMAKTVFDAKLNLSSLNVNNEDRKKIEKDMLEGALNDASIQYKNGVSGLVIFMENGFHSVHGIIASRVLERFGCPTFCVSPKEKDIVSGSLRSIEGVNIKKVLDNIQDETGCFIGYGGHTMAAGCSFKYSDIGIIREAFNKEVEKQVSTQPKPIIYIDEMSNPEEMLSLECVDQINALQPYGREFEYPVFSHKCHIINIYAIGQDKTHAKIELDIDGVFVNAVWFKARFNDSEDFKVSKGDDSRVIFTLKDNFFRGKRELQLIVSDFI